MLEVILVPFLLDKVTPQFNNEGVAGLLSCSDAEHVIENITSRAPLDVREDLIETIKQNTKPECYEGSEPNS